jgi:hypothetical protein
LKKHRFNAKERAQELSFLADVSPLIVSTWGCAMPTANNYTAIAKRLPEQSFRFNLFSRFLDG